MEREKLSKVVKNAIFHVMSDSTLFDRTDEIRDDDELAIDMAMDSLDLIEVVMIVEREINIDIPDRVFVGGPETVGELVDVLHDYIKGR